MVLKQPLTLPHSASASREGLALSFILLGSETPTLGKLVIVTKR